MKNTYFLLRASTLLMLVLMWTQVQGQLIISQYVETNSGTSPKGIELYNVSDDSINFSTDNLVIKKGVNGSTPSEVFSLTSGSLAGGEVMVIGTSDMPTDHEHRFTFNGNDALEIWMGDNKTDVFGNPGNDPGDAWTGNGVSTANQNIQLKSGITSGDTDGWTDPSTRFETVSEDPVNDLTGFGTAPAGGSGNTTVQFASDSAQANEGDGTFTLTLSISNEDADNATSCDVALTTGDAAFVDGFTTQSVEFPNGSADDQTVTVNITDDSEYTGNRTLTFSIQNVSGGNSAQAGSPSDFALTITDNEQAVVFIPYSRDFESGDLYTDGWSTQVVTGSMDWYYDSYNNDHFAEMSNYDGTNNASETWYISPAIDLSSANNPVFGFYNACNYDGADIEVNVSSDYESSGAPSSASWTSLQPILSDGNYEDVYSGDLNLHEYAGDTIYVAFKYTGTDSDGKIWQIDDIKVEEGPSLAEPTNHVSNFTATGSTDEEVTLIWNDNDGEQPAEGFLIKADTADFASIVVPADGTPENDDTNLSDGSGAVNVEHGKEAYTWNGLTPENAYYFRIYPYTNTGADINYKVDGTVPEVSLEADASTLIPDIGNKSGIKVWAHRQRMFIESPKNTEAFLQIRDISGKLVYTRQLALQKGVNAFKPDVNKGLYIMYLQIAQKAMARKIMFR